MVFYDFVVVLVVDGWIVVVVEEEWFNWCKYGKFNVFFLVWEMLVFLVVWCLCEVGLCLDDFDVVVCLFDFLFIVLFDELLFDDFWDYLCVEFVCWMLMLFVDVLFGFDLVKVMFVLYYIVYLVSVAFVGPYRISVFFVFDG